MTPQKIHKDHLKKHALTRAAALLLLILTLLLLSPAARAQNTEPITSVKVSIEQDAMRNKVDINFNSTNIIQNLLVIVSDSLGQTVFLDNQYRFKGPYIRSVDLSNSPKGNYFVKIIRDEEKINKKIHMQ